MDNIGELLVFALFIVISIVNGILTSKKKKQQKEQEQNKPDKPAPIPQRETRRESAGTVWDEIFGQPDNAEEKKTVYYGEDQTGDHATWDPEAEFKEVKKAKESRLQKVLASQKPVSKNLYYEKMLELGSSKSLEDKNSLLFPKLVLEKDKTNVRTKKITQILHQHDKLKDYILISEILGKPKSLRR